MTWLSLATKVLGGLVLVTLVVARLPPEESTIWLLFFSVVLIIHAISDFGFLPTFSRFIAYAAVTDQDRANTSTSGIERKFPMSQVLAGLDKAYSRALWVGLLVGSSLGSLAIYSSILLLSEPLVGWISWLVVVVGGCVNIYGGKYLATLQGLNLIAKQKKWEALADFMISVGAIAVVLSSADLFSLVLITQLGIVIRVAVFRLISKKQVTQYSSFSHAASERDVVMHEVWKAAWRSGLGVLFAYITVHGSILLFAQLRSPEELASLLISLRMVIIVSGFANVPFYSKIPTMNMLFVSGKNRVLKRVIRDSIGLTLTFYSISICFIGFYGNRILELLGGKVFLLDAKLWLLLGLAFFVERWGALHIQAQSVSNDIKWHIVNGLTMVFVLLFYLAVGENLNDALIIVGFLMGFSLIAAPISILLSYRLHHFDVLDFEKVATIPAFLIMLLFGVVTLLLNG